MSLCLTEFGDALGELAMMIGILVGLVGIILVTMAYPIYSSTLKKERAKIAPKILKMTDEMLR